MIERLISESNFFLIFSFLVLIAFSVLFSDALERKYKNVHTEVLRKLPHILIGVIFSITPFFLVPTEILILSIILVLCILVAKYSPWFTSVFAINRITYGMWLTPLALGIMTVMWLPDDVVPFVFGMMVLAFSDSFAALFGKIFGKKKFPYSKKTYTGSVLFFITTFFLLSLFSEKTNIPGFVLIAGVLTGLELILIFGLDNLLLPIVASLLFSFLL